MNTQLRTLICMTAAALLVGCEQNDGANDDASGNDANQNVPAPVTTELTAQAPTESSAGQSLNGQPAGDAAVSSDQPAPQNVQTQSQQGGTPGAAAAAQQPTTASPPNAAGLEGAANDPANTDVVNSDPLPGDLAEKAKQVQAELEETLQPAFGRFEQYEFSLVHLDRSTEQELQPVFRELFRQCSDAREAVNQLSSATATNIDQLIADARAKTEAIIEEVKPFEETLREALKAQGIEPDW